MYSRNVLPSLSDVLWHLEVLVQGGEKTDLALGVAAGKLPYHSSMASVHA